MSTSADFVYESLKQAIITGRLGHGEVISQVKLSEELDVARTPVREAIRMLQAEGWVEGEANKRVRVASVSPDHVEQLYAMRIVLEAMAIGVAVPGMADADLERLETLLDEMHRREGEIPGWEEAHQAFHRSLTRGAGDAIQQTCASLAQSTSRYRRIYLTGAPDALPRSDSDHHAIYDACVARDPREASVLLAKHLARTAINLVATLDPGRDPAPVRAAVNLIADQAMRAVPG
jgi:DNA-binding GntR family transcriptional regulator